MKKWSIIGTIIVILVVWIRWFLEIDHVKDSQVDEEILTGDIQEEIIEEEVTEPEDLTWDISEEELSKEEVEEPEEVNEEDIVFPDNYPMYWVIEADYWDETREDENDVDLQETEKILMQALSEFSQEENNSDL